jgi:DNA repair exonuclease SbcCD ATPase subunit
MNNIKAVRLENFQSHLDTYVEFSDGLNVIVGQSDSGKTAILRGMRWALYNQPRGSDFVRVSADFVRVTITFEDETVITRERTSSKNRYTIRKKGEEELVLEGFGTHVPNEVMEAHGMSHLKIDQDNDLMIHLSQQLDGPFLLEQTSSIRAKTLGRISGAHFLDMAIRDTTKDLSQLNLRMKQEQAEIEKLEEELQPYSHLDNLKSQLLNSELRIEKVKSMLETRKKLVEVKKQWTQINKEEDVAIAWRKLVKDVDEWQQKMEMLQAMVQQFVVFTQKQKLLGELNRSMVICEKWLEKTKHTNEANGKFEQINKQVALLKLLKLKVLEKGQINRSLEEEARQVRASNFVKRVDIAALELIREQKTKQKQLLQLQEQLNRNVEQFEQVNRVNKKLPDIRSILENHDEIANVNNRYLQIKSIQTSLLDYQFRLEEGKRFLKKQISEQQHEEQKLQDILISEGTCPTCGQSICRHKK